MIRQIPSFICISEDRVPRLEVYTVLSGLVYTRAVSWHLIFHFMRPPHSESYSKSVMCRIILSSLHTTYQDGCLMYFHILCSYCDLFILVWNLCFWEPKASMLQRQRFDASLRYDTVLNTRSRGTDAPLDWFTFLISLMSFVTQGLCAPLLLFTRLTSRSYHLRK